MATPQHIIYAMIIIQHIPLQNHMTVKLELFRFVKTDKG